MHDNSLIIDLHCHPNLKSFNSGFPKPVRTMWENIPHKIEGKFAQSIGDISQHVLKESQCNFDKMAAGGVRAFQISLYPTERGFLHMRNVPRLLVGKRKVSTLQAVITGYAEESIDEQKKHYHYWEELQNEYAYVYGQQGKSPDGEKEFVLVNNYKALQKTLKDKNTLAGILTIEGGHALGTGSPEADKLSEEELKNLMTERIEALKQWEVPPFMINLSHHFWNHLSGHSKSFKPPINSMVNQNKGKDRGITPAGWHAIRLLLSRENGKRILIDTKHMSLAARKEYYAFIENYNSINPGDKIPIVTSHAGVNGFHTMDASLKENDTAAKARKHRFFKWSINLSNEEIKAIAESEGLIGLMMDRGMLGGLNTIKEITLLDTEEKKRKAYTQLFLDNIFQVVKAADSAKGWDVIALGTDFDGTITHMEPYESAAKLPLFFSDLLHYLKEHQYQKALWYDHTPEQLMEKIMHKNAMNFYEKFFV